MDRLSDLLDPTLGRMGVRGQVRDAQVAEFFAAVVGPVLAPMCTAVRLERKTLLVETANASLAHQLHLESPRIIEQLNERLGAALVSRLRFSGMETKRRR